MAGPILCRHALACAALGLLAACAGQPQRQPDRVAGAAFHTASAAARLAYEQGQYAQARTLYSRALERAQASDAVAQSADAAYNVAVAEIALQQYDAADARLQQAEYDAERAGGPVADIRLLRAKVAYLSLRLPAARALATGVLAADAPTGVHMQARLLRGQIDAEGGAMAAAVADLQQVRQALARAAPPAAPAIRADAQKLAGTLARVDGDADAAARAFDAEADLLREAGRHRDMAHALARAGAMHGRAGRAAWSADRYYLAARSLHGQGDGAAALGFLDSAEAAARAASDPGALERTARLRAAISRRGSP